MELSFLMDEREIQSVLLDVLYRCENNLLSNTPIKGSSATSIHHPFKYVIRKAFLMNYLFEIDLSVS